MKHWHAGRESHLLEDMIAGKKTIEGRLCRGKFAQYKIGDMIHLRRDWRDSGGVLHDGEPDVARVEVVAIRRYQSFLSMMHHEDYRRVIPAALSPEQAAAVYDRYYSREEQKLYGVLAIEVRLV